MTPDVVYAMFTVNTIGVAFVLLAVWCPIPDEQPHATRAQKLEREKGLRAAARVTLTIPLWMWVVWPILALLLLYVIGDKIHDLWLMAKSPPKQMSEPPSGKGPYR